MFNAVEIVNNDKSPTVLVVFKPVEHLNQISVTIGNSIFTDK